MRAAVIGAGISGARLFVSSFLKSYISGGTLILLEEGGTILTFEGSQKRCPLKVTLRIHSPRFYRKVMTQADLGLAETYINGDFSLVDKDEGLLNLFRSNEFFELFLDETMAYTCAIFKTADEELKVAQKRKISLLTEKARVEKHHHVLELGFGWGSLAIEVVRQTGCKYTGITLSKEQLKYAEMKVKEVGLQDHIKFILCDYRQLPANHKFDRIIACGMVEHVGHEYMEEFFRCCESALADDGLLVLQFISMVDQMYDDYRRCPGFIKCRASGEYRNSLLPDIEMLEKEFHGKTKIVFSRPGKDTAFSNPYESFPAA